MDKIIPYLLPELIDRYDGNIPEINFNKLFQTYIVYCVIWYIAYMFFEYAIIRSCFSNSSKKVKGMGRSYLASTLNALLCSICGIYICMKMKDENVLCKYFFISCDDTKLLNFTLISGAQLSAHFSNDLIGLFFTYPRDPRETNAAIVIHHLIFLSCGIIGSVFYLTPFTYAWLNLCEISTIPLNIRWFAINTGNGNSCIYWFASYSFVLCFVIFRIIMYGIGLFDIYLKYEEIQQHAQALSKHTMKINCTVVVLILVSIGWILQLYWFVTGILPLLFRKGGKKKQKKEQ